MLQLTVSGLTGHLLSVLPSCSLLVRDVDISWHWQMQLLWVPLKQVQMGGHVYSSVFPPKHHALGFHRAGCYFVFIFNNLLPSSPMKGGLGTSTLSYSSRGLALICLIHYRLSVWPGANHFGLRPQGDLGRTQILTTGAYPIPNFLLVGMCKIASALIRARQFFMEEFFVCSKMHFRVDGNYLQICTRFGQLFQPKKKYWKCQNDLFEHF